MKSEDFDYHLPEELIAYYPTEKRDDSRLLVLNRSEKSLSHNKFFDLTDFLIPGDLLVLNNTEVIPAKLKGKREGVEIELLLTERIGTRQWKLLITKPKNGLKIKFNDDISGEIKKIENDWVIEFDVEADEYIESFGKMPLPPYIERESEDVDKSRYQTVYARSRGAIAAPTAGLHFTPDLIDRIRDQCVEIKYITLHVGIGTFRPVKTENITDHIMHKEFVNIPEDTASAVNFAKKNSRRVICVGTTVVRALESAVSEAGDVSSYSGFTDLFIYPPYKYKVVDGMITNFHLPKSTLLMLVSAFCGKDLLLGAYDEAISQKYRFLSYGDAMLII